MQFALVPLLGREVKAVGFEHSDVFAHLDWTQPDRWRLDFNKLETQLRGSLQDATAKEIPGSLVLQLQVYDFKVWGEVFGTVGFGSRYSRPKRQLTLSVRLDYSKLKRLDAASQFERVLRGLGRSAQSAATTIDAPTTISLSKTCAVIKAAAAGIKADQVEALPREA